MTPKDGEDKDNYYMHILYKTHSKHNLSGDKISNR